MVYPNANISPKQANNSIKKEKGATPSLLKPNLKLLLTKKMIRLLFLKRKEEKAIKLKMVTDKQ